MDFRLIQKCVEQWAADKHLLGKGWEGAEAQFKKLEEEVEELREAIDKEDMLEARDAIGDCIVVLTNIALNLGTTPQYCYLTAWEQIKNRKGKTVDGVFIKEG
jgi:NTP pyrophosphatase (non-canonical NTP hydrolase)